MSSRAVFVRDDFWFYGEKLGPGSEPDPSFFELDQIGRLLPAAVDNEVEA